MAGDFGPTEESFNYDAPPKWQEALKNIEIILNLLYYNDQESVIVKRIMLNLQKTAKELERLSGEIASHPAVKGKYSYDGGYFESDAEIIECSNGQHFFETFTTEALTQMHSASGKKELENKINRACMEDLQKTIIQSGSVALMGKFENPTKKK